jgi:hypothetical protein
MHRPDATATSGQVRSLTGCLITSDLLRDLLLGCCMTPLTFKLVLPDLRGSPAHHFPPCFILPGTIMTDAPVWHQRLRTAHHPQLGDVS